MTIAFDYLNDFHVLMCFFKLVSRSRLCQRLEERELRSLEEHPPLADLRHGVAFMGAVDKSLIFYYIFSQASSDLFSAKPVG
jgi:hypothetical protein